MIGNPVLACRQVPVSALFTKQWVLWEREVKRVLNGEDVPLGRVLICNQLPGVPLADWLIDLGEPNNAHLEVLEIAIESLQKFHRVAVDDGQGGRVRLSHGDATLNNVLYDSENRLAMWIDFDLRHWLNVPAPQRHADDLRAFLFSAVRHLPDAEIPEFLTAMQLQYEDAAVWNCLRDQLASRWFRFDVFHRAHVRRGSSGNESTQEVAQRLTILASLICSNRSSV